jgi:hypothetical protein
MSEIIADLHLPISQQVLRQIIDGGADNLEKAISSLGVSQIASLLLLQNIPKMKYKPPAYFERILEEAIDIWNSQLKRDGLSSVRAKGVSVLNFKNIEEGYKLLPDFRMALLDEEAVRDQNYLTFEGKWDYEFNKRCREEIKRSLVHVNDMAGKIQTLTSEQSRIYQEIKAQTDDHLHVQGYAGTGKSSLIRNLISMLDRKGVQVLMLAERQKQLEALVCGTGQVEHVFSKTFGNLAREMIPRDLTNTVNWNMRKQPHFVQLCQIRKLSGTLGLCLAVNSHHTI